MKKILVIGGIAATTLLVGGWALAQATGPGGFGPPFMRGMGPGGMGPGMMQHMGRGMGPGMMMHGGPSQTFADPAQIETLKKELGITSAQEPAWTKYAKAIQDSAATMKATRDSVDPEAVSKMSSQDRYAFMTKMREQGQKQFEAVQTVANELLATLDDAQKAKARDTLPGLAAFGPGMMHNAMGGPHHQHWGR